MKGCLKHNIGLSDWSIESPISIPKKQKINETWYVQICTIICNLIRCRASLLVTKNADASNAYRSICIVIQYHTVLNLHTVSILSISTYFYGDKCKIITNLGSCRPNLSQFWVVNKLTKLLKNQKLFGDYVVHVNDHPQINLQYFCSVSPEIMWRQARHFGGGHIIRAVLAILYQVLHSFYRVFWVMRQGRKI